MSILTNSPRSNTILRLERRKSFSLALWFKDPSGRILDVTGCTVRIAAKQNTAHDDQENLFLSDTAIMTQADIGYVRFDLQAFDLDVSPGEYPFVITLVDATGYSSAVVKGDLEVLDNAEADSIQEEYEEANPPSTIEVWMQGKSAINVSFGFAMPPGTTSFLTTDSEKLDQLNPEAQLPPGGYPGNVLTRSGSDDYGTRWTAAPAGSGGGLDADGIPEGYLPTANGEGTWNWEEPPESGVTTVNGLTGAVLLGLGENIPEGPNAKTVTAAEKSRINDINTAAYQAVAYFRRSSEPIPFGQLSGMATPSQVPKVAELRGIQYGTGTPASSWTGTPAAGDIYIQLES